MGIVCFYLQSLFQMNYRFVFRVELSRVCCIYLIGEEMGIQRGKRWFEVFKLVFQFRVLIFQLQYDGCYWWLFRVWFVGGQSEEVFVGGRVLVGFFIFFSLVMSLQDLTLEFGDMKSSQRMGWKGQISLKVIFYRFMWFFKSLLNQLRFFWFIRRLRNIRQFLWYYSRSSCILFCGRFSISVYYQFWVFSYFLKYQGQGGMGELQFLSFDSVWFFY